MSQTQVERLFIKDKEKLMATQWKVNASFTSGTGSELLDPTFTQLYSIGSAMTVSSGTWTFPFTGFFKVQFFVNFGSSQGSAYRGGDIRFTTNNSDYTVQHSGYTHTNDNQYTAIGPYTTIVDVTDTSNCKVRFHIENAATGTISTYTRVMFEYIGDT